MEILIEKLSKRYGKKEVLKEVSLSIPEGMYGLLGKNGAGKTSLLRILATLQAKSSGAVTMNGVPICDTKIIRGMVGYLPQDFSLYPNMCVYQAMDYLGVLSKIPGHERADRIRTLLKAVNLQEHSKTKIKALSGGMRRRLGIAQALLHDPQILIIDEPTAGLDPEERIRFRNLLCEFAENRIVVLSTHIAEDIETTCRNVAVLNQGRLLFSDTTEELIRKAEGKVYSIEVSKKEIDRMKKKYQILSMQTEQTKIRCRVLSDHVPEEPSNRESPTLEDGYMELLREHEGGVRL